MILNVKESVEASAPAGNRPHHTMFRLPVVHVYVHLNSVKSLRGLPLLGMQSLTGAFLQAPEI